MTRDKQLPRILMIVENKFPQDARIRNEATCLSESGYVVTVICLRGKRQRSFEKWNSISVYRMPDIRDLKKKIITSKSNKLYAFLGFSNPVFIYCIEYLFFLGIAFIYSLFVSVREGFDVVHAHNPPDFLFIMGAFYKIFRKKFVFDQHDLVPDMYLAKYNEKNSVIYKTLLLAERLSCQLADAVIVTNKSYKNITSERNKISETKIQVVRNGPGPDLITFKPPSSHFTLDENYTLTYVGNLNTQDGGYELINVLRALVYTLKVTNFQCVIVGDGETLDELKRYCRYCGLHEYVFFTGWVSQEKAYEAIEASDICLSPEPFNEYNDKSSFVKIVEYMALGKPIVAFDLKETRYTARDAALYVTPNNELEFAQTVQRLIGNPELRGRMGAAGRKRVEERLAWRHISKNLVMKYEEITKRATCNR